MALTDYSIDTSGTPQDVQRRQRLADLLMQQGMDTSPAAGGKGGGWITALNRGLAGALAGYQQGQIRQDELARNKANDAQMAALSSALMGGATTPAPAMGSIGAPDTTPAAQPAQPASPRPKVPVVAALEEEDKPSTPTPAPPPGADSGLPTFGPDGKMMGNLTGNIGQPPAGSVSAPAPQPAPQSAPERTPAATVADRFPQQPVQAGQNPQAVAAAWAVIRNPYATPAAKQVASAIVTQSLTPKEVHTQETDKDGNIWDVNRLTGQRTIAKAAEKDPEAVRLYEYSKTHPDFVEYQKQAKTPMVNIDQKAETEQGKAIGKAKGEVQAEDIKAGAHAVTKLRQLATLDDANKNGGDDISSGPLGKAILSGKQGFSELTGVDLKGVPESEVIQKVGFGLATNMVKAITNRPSQMEFGKALENVPGLFMSKQGRIAMTSILTQEARAEQELGRRAYKHKDVEGGPTWQDVKDKYYEDHPLISPFTGKPFGEADVQMLTKSAPASGTAANGATVVDGYTIKER